MSGALLPPLAPRSPPAGPREHPICNVFCLRPRAGNLADEAVFGVVRSHVRSAFGPWVNLISLPLGGDPLGRAGLTSRTVYDLNHCAHGVIICGSADARSTESLDFDPQALENLDLPILGLGWAGQSYVDAEGTPAMRVLGLRADHQRALAARTSWLLCRDAPTRAWLQSVGAEHAVLGGCPTLTLEPEAIAWEEAHPDTGVLITVRDPARMGIPASNRAEFVGALRDLIATLRRQGHASVHLLCVDAQDLAFATSLARADFLFVDQFSTFTDRLRHAELHITFREDAALMCAALGHPFVHFACGADTRRPLEMAGLWQWSMGLDDLSGLGVRALQQAARFGELDALRIAALPAWADFERVTARQFRRFAQAVLDRRTEDAHRRAVPEGNPALTSDETRVEVIRTPR